MEPNKQQEQVQDEDSSVVKFDESKQYLPESLDLNKVEYHMISYYINEAMKRGLTKLTLDTLLIDNTIYKLKQKGYTISKRNSWGDRWHIISWAGKPKELKGYW